MAGGFPGTDAAARPGSCAEMARRALVLERIAALSPVGRRQLAARLNLPEREIRSVAAFLKEEGFIHLDAAGMTLTPKAESILPSAREFSRAMRGLTALETRWRPRCISIVCVWRQVTLTRMPGCSRM